MRHVRERHRARTAEQFDLFGAPASSPLRWAPAWEALPPHARAELTTLMVRLILEHAQSQGAVATEAARHEP